MLNKCKVCILPAYTNETDAPIGLFIDTKKLFLRNPLDLPRGIGCHLYIISDEGIEENDWCYDTHNNEVIISPKGGFKGKIIKKIIATTNKMLTTNNVSNPLNITQELPGISYEFIHKYVEDYNDDNKITEVMVEYKIKWGDEPNDGPFVCTGEYLDINLLKPHVKIDNNNQITIFKIKDNWTKEEVIDLCYKCWVQAQKTPKNKLSERRFKIFINENL